MKQKAVLTKRWKDNLGEDNVHTDSDRERWKEGKREQESLRDKGPDSALTQAETNPAEVCDKWMYLSPQEQIPEGRNTCLVFCLSQGSVFITYQVS